MNENYENEKQKLEKMLAKCPDVLTPLKAVKWMPIGRNTLYEAINKGEIETYVYQGGYILTKDSIIEYILKTAKNTKRTFAITGKKRNVK